MSAANRRRGHNAERAVVRYLREQGWPDACTTRAKLGHDGAHAPGDIDWHPLIVLEVKDVARSAYPSWCRQAVAEAAVGQVPVVVRRTRGVPDVGQWECRVKVRDLWRVFGRLSIRQRHVGSVDGEAWDLLPFSTLVRLVREVEA